MVTITTPLTYVALIGEYPVGVGRDLDAVQLAAQRQAPQKDYSTGEQREFRWDEIDTYSEWQLMALNQRTNRWNKTGYVVRTAPLVGTDPAV